ncbi:MAG TPA: ABC transporter substrate-binding protein [Verrucomicrobiae bacterium]|nr:ABC transporter substrate-binding protein [Verrucomicrobiae bacterium]
MRPHCYNGIRSLIAGLFAVLAAPAALAQDAAIPSQFIEPPILAEQVASGALPPVAERLPSVPSVAKMEWEGQTLGQHGGEMRMLMTSTKDTRIMVVYGDARLVNYNKDYQLVPDILQAFEAEEGRIFTFHLRPGHKWSDGSPFTTEDFRYYWEDVANNPDISPAGPPVELLVDGEAPKVEILDETTIRYSWSKPNWRLLPAIAGPSPLYIYRPSKYLKQYHAKYVDPAKLAEMIEESGQQNWAALHNRKDNMYRNDNIELPTLEPWVLATKPPTERFVFKRNPYYYRVDSEGRQLPYLDAVSFQVTDGKLVPAKAASGEADLAARYVRFDNFTLLKENEKRGNYNVRLWETAWGSQVALYPNLNASDPGWRELLRDVRFRRALSIAIDRSEINQVIYLGLGVEAANTVLPQSPLFDAEISAMWSVYDPDGANALLDEIGLTQRNSDGIRLMKDGRPLEITVLFSGQSPEEGDVLELIQSQWMNIGVRLFFKPSERDTIRDCIFSGDCTMSVWTGLENALPTADMSPWELAPISQMQFMWPKWGQYLETKGEAGEAPDLPEANELLTKLASWGTTTDIEQRTAIWQEMLKIYATQVYSIGTVAGVPQPVVVSNHLHNVPKEAVYSWDPGAHFGIYKPDCFWIDPAN